ncbi:MAG: ATPase, partial [Arenibacterium sp.]
INTTKDEWIQLIMVGRREWRRHIPEQRRTQLARRVGASSHHNRRGAKGRRAYVAHRVRTAGGTGQEFSPEAIDLVFEATGGVPRLINQLCDLGLLYCWTDDMRQVQRKYIKAVLDDGTFFWTENRQVETQD